MVARQKRGAIALLIAWSLVGPVTGQVPKLHYALNVFRQLVSILTSEFPQVRSLFFR
jgi:hypothetical protein